VGTASTACNAAWSTLVQQAWRKELPEGAKAYYAARIGVRANQISARSTTTPKKLRALTALPGTKPTIPSRN
jgi:hypothetical protein